jgi:hypothetical protein
MLVNPVLYKLLAGYVEFMRVNGVDRDQRLHFTFKEFAKLFNWDRVTTPRLRGLEKQCKMLGIIFIAPTNLNEPFVFRLHDLRLVNNYSDLAKLGD